MQGVVSFFVKLFSVFGVILLEQRIFNQKRAHFSSYWRRLASLMPLWNQNLALLSKMKASDAVHAVATRTTLCACGDNVPMLRQVGYVLRGMKNGPQNPGKALKRTLVCLGNRVGMTREVTF
jgi:hypothetical protein